MEILGGATRSTLSGRDDRNIVSRPANFIREAVRPLMRSAFTRRVTVWAYELISPHPELPRDLGGRPEPAYVPLDSARYIPTSHPGFEGGGGQPDLLRDAETGDIYIFKGEDTAYLTFRTHAIDALSQPLRARAAALVAAAFGVPTPEVTLVEVAGRRGSLQKVVPGMLDLAKLDRADSRRFKRLIHSREFAMQRSDIWILDRAIGNLDRQSHNMLVGRDPAATELVAIDHDLSFPPVRDYRPMLGVHGYTPRQVRRETYATLCAIARDPARLIERLEPLLTRPEIDAMLARIADTVTIIDNTIHFRGAAAVFF